MAKNTVPKKDDPLDWHPARIVYELRLKGWSMRRLSKENGLNPTSLSVGLQRPWPRAERIIADALGLNPVDIWPSRYPEAQKPMTRSA